VIGSERGVSFIVPVLNGRRTLKRALASIVAQRDGRPFEIIAIDDGSVDGSSTLLDRLQAEGVLRVVRGDGRGAAAAINTGIREAVHPIVCQVDQDVILQANWLIQLIEPFSDPEIAAVQGHYITAPEAGFWARSMGLDLTHRYSQIRTHLVDHVCTGNTAYRASALHQVGLLDESLGYGYDNDLSYRLQQSGHRLAFCRTATSIHCWREGLGGYLRQQFGVGYGRLDVLAKHPRRISGDDVSGMVMMLHAPAMLAALGMIALATVGAGWHASLFMAMGIIGALVAERSCAGVMVWRQNRDRTALAFGLSHLVRDAAWSIAILLWIARGLFRRKRTPAHSMLPQAQLSPVRRHAAGDGNLRLLAVVPAYNERANLLRVVADLSRVIPRRDILIVNDGSTDGTPDLLPSLGVRWLTLSQRLGVGGAVQAGIRYAQRGGYTCVVRIDGDAQHRACDIARLLAPVASGRVDVALGSRFLRRRAEAPRFRRWTQALLAMCLSIVTRRRVTDPTSGFWLFGPKALRLLSGHHPAGYAEPELLLFLGRNGLCVSEVPIRMRPRTAGRTSLTAARTVLAFARTALAFVVVPFRQLVDGQAHD
jgi:glycosyltransferase involved in cell wall biosynthesis